MRELVPIVKCDRCDAAISIETPSSIVNLDLADQAPRRYSGENCTSCQADLEDALTQLLGEFLIAEQVKLAKQRAPRGSAPVEPRSDPGVPEVDRTCPVCGFVSRSRGGLGQHVNDKHHTNLSGLGIAKVRGKHVSTRVA